MQNDGCNKKNAGETTLLTPARLQQLKSIDCPLETRPTKTFEEKLEEWKAFEDAHNGQKDPPRGSLREWVLRQRKRYHDERLGLSSRFAPLSKRQMELLKKNNFRFGQRLPDRRQVSWDERYRDLVTFKEQHGHANVPQLEPGGLGQWIHKQRKYYRDNDIKNLSQERIDKLEKIGLQWRLRVRGPNKTKQPARAAAAAAAAAGVASVLYHHHHEQHNVDATSDESMDEHM